MSENDVSDLDEKKLSDYLSKNVFGFQGPIKAEKFPGGQSNPTFLIRAASGKYVLRRQPPGTLLKSAHAVDREFRVLEALAATEVPVAKAYHLCEDAGVIGSMFYLMSFEEGRIFWDPALPEVDREQRNDYYRELIKILAAMHNIKPSDVGLADYGKPGNYYLRQYNLWCKQYRTTQTRDIAAMEKLMLWLGDHCPDELGEQCLVHGDYRIDNVMFTNEGSGGLAVLDWELSTLGHPLADLAYFCMCLRMPRDGNIVGLAGLDLDAIGVPSEEEIIEIYCKERGIEKFDNWTFYLAFSLFRLAAIIQGVLKRSLDGNASNERAESIGQMTEPIAEMALRIIEGE